MQVLPPSESWNNRKRKHPAWDWESLERATAPLLHVKKVKTAGSELGAAREVDAGVEGGTVGILEQGSGLKESNTISQNADPHHCLSRRRYPPYAGPTPFGVPSFPPNSPTRRQAASDNGDDYGYPVKELSALGISDSRGGSAVAGSAGGVVTASSIPSSPSFPAPPENRNSTECREVIRRLPLSPDDRHDRDRITIFEISDTGEETRLPTISELSGSLLGTPVPGRTELDELLRRVTGRVGQFALPPLPPADSSARIEEVDDDECDEDKDGDVGMIAEHRAGAVDQCPPSFEGRDTVVVEDVEPDAMDVD